jgi:hypothetical protein
MPSRQSGKDKVVPKGSSGARGKTISDWMRDDESDPMPTTSPPATPPAPTKRKMTRDEIKAQMDKAGQTVPKNFAKGGAVGSASRRGDGIAQRGKTKGKFV